MSETTAEPQSNPTFPDTDELEWFLKEVDHSAFHHRMDSAARKRMLEFIREQFGQNLPEPRFGYKKKPPPESSG